MPNNRNPLKQIEICFPHSRCSDQHPHHQLMKEDLAEFLQSVFDAEGLILAEEPHPEARPALHIHVLMLLKKKETLTRVKNVVNEQYSYMFGNTIEYRAVRNTYSFYQYITVPGYQTGNPDKPPKAIEDVDPEPLIIGRTPIPPGGSRPYSDSDWKRLCGQVYRNSGIILEHDWAAVKAAAALESTDEFMKVVIP